MKAENFLEIHPKLKRFIKEKIVPITPLRISSVGAILHNKAMSSMLENMNIDGDVLDVGSQRKEYQKYFSSEQYFSLDSEKRWNPDICCDAHNIECEDNRFSLVIASELLEHCYDPQKVVDEIYRVLKPGGVCLFSSPFMVCYHVDKGIKDYYRFTRDGLTYLFRKFSISEIKHEGNRMQLIWDSISSGNLVLSFFLKIFNTPISWMITTKDSRYSRGYILTASKQKQQNGK